MEFNFFVEEKSLIIVASYKDYRKISDALDIFRFCSLYEIRESFCSMFIFFSVYCDGIRSEYDIKVICDYIRFLIEHDYNKTLIEKAKKSSYPEDLVKAFELLVHDSSESLRVSKALEVFERRVVSEKIVKKEAEAKVNSDEDMLPF